MRRFRTIGGWGALLAALVCAGRTLGAGAQQAPEQHARVELLANSFTIPGYRTIWVGLLFHMDPGWHIYWRNAGDSGEPPKVTWQIPPGFKAGSIRWPQPVRLGSGSVIDYGYENQVLLMLPVEAERDAKSEAIPQIAADVKYVVCREVCIPAKAHLALTTPSAPDNYDKLKQVAKWRELFDEEQKHLPKSAPREWKASAEEEKDQFVLTVRADGQPAAGMAHLGPTGASFFPMDADEIENSAPQTFKPFDGGFRLTLKKSEQLIKPVATLHGLLVLGPDRAYDVTAPVHRQSD